MPEKTMVMRWPCDVKGIISALELVTTARVKSYSITGNELRIVFVEPEPEPTPDYSDECKMCGKERSLNDVGYCSSCWQIWNF